jgi:hypothetical protein
MKMRSTLGAKDLGRGATKGHSQHEIRIDDVVEALQEDAEDAESSQNSRCRWNDPVNGSCEPCPSEPIQVYQLFV